MPLIACKLDPYKVERHQITKTLFTRLNSIRNNWMIVWHISLVHHHSHSVTLLRSIRCENPTPPAISLCLFSIHGAQFSPYHGKPCGDASINSTTFLACLSFIFVFVLLLFVDDVPLWQMTAIQLARVVVVVASFLSLSSMGPLISGIRVEIFM